MPTYRAYLLDKAGAITWGEWLEADDLVEARTKAAEMCRPHTPTVELWQGAAKLAEV